MTTINSSQPGSSGATFVNLENEFSAGLFDCCSDFGTLAYAFFCFPCFQCSVYQDAGECLCTPFFCPASASLRTKVRQGYRIRGQMWKDYAIMYFFGFCAFLQISNELKLQGDAKN